MLSVIRVSEDGYLIGYTVVNDDAVEAAVARLQEARPEHSRADITVHPAGTVSDLEAVLHARPPGVTALLGDGPLEHAAAERAVRSCATCDNPDWCPGCDPAG